MSYRVTNRIVQKGARSTVWKHVMWGALALAVVGPASYMFGRASGPPEWNKPYVRDVWGQRAVTESREQDIPETVRTCLTALGPAEITRASLNGRTVYSSRYPVQGFESVEGKLQGLQSAWQFLGLQAQVVKGAVIGMDLNQEFLLNASVSVDDPRAIQVDCWESKGGGEGLEAATAALEAADLPAPPSGTKIDNLSEGRQGNAFSFTVSGDVDVVAEEYMQQLEEKGWTPQELPGGKPDVTSHFQLYRKGNHHLTVQFASIAGTGTIASLIVF